MKILRVAAVVIVLLAAVLAPAAPVLREAWASTEFVLGHTAFVARVAMLPWAVAGSFDAMRDIGDGQLIVLHATGWPLPWRNDYIDLLRVRYGIQTRSVPGGCVVLVRRDARYAGYTAVMHHEIERRHGKGVLDRLAQEAQRKHEQTAALTRTP